MKWVIYLLLLANLGVFVWHYQDVDSLLPAKDVKEGKSDKSSLSLVLLKEFNPREKTPAKSGKQCYSLGPFRDKKQAALARRVLQAEGINVKQNMRKDARRKAYWVLLPPAESRAAAKQTIARLKQLKLDDYFLVVSGDQTNAISLGVFTQFESAHRRIKQIQALGFTPRFEKVELPKREYWLDWPLSSNKHISDDAMGRIHKIRQEVQVTERNCN